MAKTKEILEVQLQNLDMDLVVVKHRMERLLAKQRQLLAEKQKLVTAMKK